MHKLKNSKMHTMNLMSQFSNHMQLRLLAVELVAKKGLPAAATATLSVCDANTSISACGYRRTQRFSVLAESHHYAKTVPAIHPIPAMKLPPVSSLLANRMPINLFPTTDNYIRHTNHQLSFPCYYHTSRLHYQQDGQTGSSQSHDKTSNSSHNTDTLIETWFYEVSPYGSLEACLPFRTEICPLPPQDYPDMNKVIIQLHYDAQSGQNIPSGRELSQIADLYDLKVAFDEDKANMRISCDIVSGVTVPVVCSLQVPIKCDLKLKSTEDKEISVQRMESNVITIESERGTCNLRGIKCGSINAVCRSGNITCKSTLLGNVFFHTGKSGSITTDKLQGSNITCETEMGSMVVKSLYADNAIFRTDAGNVHLGQCHGQLYMQAESSQIKIESLDGDLDIGLQSGTVEVHLSRHNKANVEVQTGDISLSFPEGVNTDLNLDCRGIVTDGNIDVQFAETGQPHHKEGNIGEKGKALVNARTLSGTIHLKFLDWIQTTKLAFKTDDDT